MRQLNAYGAASLQGVKRHLVNAAPDHIAVVGTGVNIPTFGLIALAVEDVAVIHGRGCYILAGGVCRIDNGSFGREGCGVVRGVIARRSGAARKGQASAAHGSQQNELFTGHRRSSSNERIKKKKRNKEDA